MVTGRKLHKARRPFITHEDREDRLPVVEAAPWVGMELRLEDVVFRDGVIELGAHAWAFGGHCSLNDPWGVRFRVTDELFAEADNNYCPGGDVIIDVPRCAAGREVLIPRLCHRPGTGLSFESGDDLRQLKPTSRVPKDRWPRIATDDSGRSVMRVAGEGEDLDLLIRDYTWASGTIELTVKASPVAGCGDPGGWGGRLGVTDGR